MIPIFYMDKRCTERISGVDPRFETLRNRDNCNEQQFGWGLSYPGNSCPGNSSGNSCPGNSATPDAVDKLRKMLAFLDDMEDPEELRALPSWKVHTLSGDRKGTWSLSVTANRRLTFRIDTGEREIYDVNLEDYH
jgi:toxin HigB-1